MNWLATVTGFLEYVATYLGWLARAFEDAVLGFLAALGLG